MCLVLVIWVLNCIFCFISGIECPTPVVPTHGRVVEEATQSAGVYGVGAVVQFACLSHARLNGEPSIVCTETGFWSQPPPLCK